MSDVIVTDNTPKRVPIMPGMSRSTQERIKRDEEELRELLSQQRKGQPPEETVETEETSTTETVEKETKTEAKSAAETNYEKRYKDSQRFITKLTQQVKELEERVKASASEMPTSKEDVEAWMKKYPQSAKVIETMILSKTDEIRRKYDEEKEALENMRFEALREKTEVEVLKVHPDFSEIKDSDDFHKWLEDQSAEFQRVIYDTVDQPKSVISIVRAYKADKGIGGKPKFEEDEDTSADAARTLKTRKQTPQMDTKREKGLIYESDVARMDIRQYAANLDKINEARRTGKFIYDISGKNA